MSDEASKRERERERRKSLAAKLPMEEVEKHMAELRLSNNLTQDELQTCRDGLQAQLLHGIFDAFGTPLPTGPQDAVQDPEGLPLEKSGKPQRRPAGQEAGYLERLFSPQPLSEGVQVQWVSLAKMTGWQRGSTKTAMANELCGAALHLTLFNQGVDTDHLMYKKLYDVGIVMEMDKHIRMKKDVSQGLARRFEYSWLGTGQSSGSAGDTYVEAGWLEGSELELDPVSFEEVVTKYLMTILRRGKSGPEDWQNKPPESYLVVQPPTRPHAGSATSDGESDYAPSNPDPAATSDTHPSLSNSPESRPTSTPINTGRSASRPAQPSVGETDDGPGKIVIRRKHNNQIVWDKCKVGEQLLDDWLIKQESQGQSFAGMSDLLDEEVSADTLRKRCKRLGKKRTKT